MVGQHDFQTTENQSEVSEDPEEEKLDFDMVDE
jgi:hypothetical protein